VTKISLPEWLVSDKRVFRLRPVPGCVQTCLKRLF